MTTIVIDENIPYAEEAFSSIGRVIKANGREINRDMLIKTDANILCVRSITKVNESLLASTKVRFVTTATIGFDHIDIEYLKREKIGFSSAPGTNANSVAEYIISALLAYSLKTGKSLQNKTMGIIGVGNVGSKVAAKVPALGIKPILNDPPLAHKTGKDYFVSLSEIKKADIISFHTPLTKEGNFKTEYLGNKEFFYECSNSPLIINSSRGKVLDESALNESIESKKVSGAILDVFENEPKIEPSYAKNYSLITPHIAGYSFDGKVAGTYYTYKAVCTHLEIKPRWQVSDSVPTVKKELVIDNTKLDFYESLAKAVFSSYDIRKDDSDLRKVLENSEENGFDRIRKNYPQRREFRFTAVRLAKLDYSLISSLTILGFNLP